MNVLLNGMEYSPGRMGGVETYFRNLVDHLGRNDASNDYRILMDASRAKYFPVRTPNITIIPFHYSMPSIGWFVRGSLRHTLNLDILGLKIERLAADVIHHPFSVVNPSGLKIPSVLTFWDLQHEYYPEYFSRYELWLRKRVYKASVEESARIIVSAEYTKRCLVERYRVDLGKIDVIPVGYGSEFRIIDDRDGMDRISNKYGLTRPFLYYPAATWPHKNHEKLFAALTVMKNLCRFDGDLVLSGIAMQSHKEFRTRIEKAGLGETVKVLGYLPFDDLPYLYNLARILVFPSLFEGFGIPVVEAMACGCPVACSNVTTLPEVVGEAGVLFDPASPVDMAEKICSVWNDSEKRQSMREMGLKRVNSFKWEDTARKTLDVYKKAIG
jgi:glycosyltransferase involved in cell wall biosynthesis